MMKNFMTLGPLSGGKKPEGDLGRKGMAPAPGKEQSWPSLPDPSPILGPGTLRGYLSVGSLAHCS
jgi:hypothetical protein